jgi:pimeloyl-ACP methyl ester carboxylesterase
MIHGRPAVSKSSTACNSTLKSTDAGSPSFSCTPRLIVSQYADRVPQEQWKILRRSHPGGDAQIQALLDSTEAFATRYDDMTFTPPSLSTIQVRTLIVQGERDPLYPVELSVEMARAIPQSSLWIVPNAGHGSVIGERWPEFQNLGASFLRQ